MAEQPPLRPDTPPGQTPSQPANVMSWGSIPQMTNGMTFGEYGSSGLRAFSGWVREEFVPELIGRQGARTYREMADNSPVVGAMLFAIKATMLKVEWRVIPPQDTGQATEKQDFVDSLMRDMSHTWEEHVEETLSMLQYGYAPHEIVYKRRLGRHPGPDPRRPGRTLPKSDFDDGLIGWRRLPLRGQETVLKWFFDENGTVMGMTQQPWTGPIIDLPIEKMLLFRPNVHKGNPEGRSILRNAWRPYHFTKRIEEQEAILFERLNGFPIVRVPNTLIEQARSGNADATAMLNSYKTAATNIRLNEQMGMLLSSQTYTGDSGQPSSVYQYDIQFITPEARRTGAVPSEVIERYGVQMMQSVMVDFLALGHGQRGSQALAVNKTDMFFQAVEGLLNANGAIYNKHGIPRVWELNGFDDELMPEISPDLAQRVDLDVLSNFVMRLGQAGMPLFPNEELQSYLLDAAGLPDVVDPMAMEAAGLTEELIGQQTAVDTGKIPDPKQVQAMSLQQQPGNDNQGNPKDMKNPQGNFGKMLRASIARRIMRMGGSRQNVVTKRRRSRHHERARQLVGKASPLEKVDVWLVRHGADDNAGIINGWNDVPLSTEGEAEAQEIATKLADKGIDIIFYSDLDRSRCTAMAIAARTGAGMIASPGLRCWNLGALQGEKFSDVKDLINEYMFDKPWETPPGGESFSDFKFRVFKAIEDALDASTGQQLALVTHSKVERLLQAWADAGSRSDLSISKTTMKGKALGTGEAKLMTIDAGAIRMALNGIATYKSHMNGTSRLQFPTIEAQGTLPL